MFRLFKSKNKQKDPVQTEQKDTGKAKPKENLFKWYEKDDDANPFNKRILDVRSITQTMVAFAKSESVVIEYNRQRSSFGKEFIGREIEGNNAVEVNMVYPHNGTKMEGVTFKARCMEDKWDIYTWHDIMYFVRSWTGQLAYKAFVNVTGPSFTIYRIEYLKGEHNKEDESLVSDNVHFLIMTCAMGRVFPHRVPRTIVDEEEIALFSFNIFGRNCAFATHETIIDTAIKQKEMN